MAWFPIARPCDTAPVFADRVRIYTGVLGQIGDVVAFTATVRRVKELWPNAEITFAVSARYREAGELVAGLPYVDRLFVTRFYFEKLTPRLFAAWERGWPVDLRGDDEVMEQRKHDIVLDTRPRHCCSRWYETATQAEELAQMVGVPGPIDPRPEIAIPPETAIPDEWRGRIALHNDPAIDARKAWPWEHARELVSLLGPGRVALLGGSGPELPGTFDLRGRTTLAQAAAVIRDSRCFIGIDSGLTCIAAALRAKTVGIYGTEYVPVCSAVQPANPNADYLSADGPTSLITPRRVAEAVERQLGA